MTLWHVCFFVLLDGTYQPRRSGWLALAAKREDNTKRKVATERQNRKKNLSSILGTFAKFAKSDYYLRHVCPCVRPHGVNWLPLYEFSWNLTFECLSKICQENSSFIKIGQERRLLYMKTNIHDWSYLAQFFLEWEMFQTNFVEKYKTHISCPITFFNGAVYELVWKNIAQSGRSQMTTWRMRTTCRIHKATNILSEHVAFLLQPWLHECATMLR